MNVSKTINNILSDVRRDSRDNWEIIQIYTNAHARLSIEDRNVYVGAWHSGILDEIMLAARDVIDEID